MENTKMNEMKGFILGFRKKELEQFLKPRGFPTYDLKKVLQDKALEILVEEDYQTISDLHEAQFGIKKDESNNENATSTQTNAFQNIPKANAMATSTQTNAFQNILEANQIVNTLQKRLEECMIDENSMEDDKTGLFYIKYKIFKQTTLAPMFSKYSFNLTEAQYLEMLESRHNVDELLKFDVQLQLRFFKNGSIIDAVTQGAKIWLNGIEIPIMTGAGCKPINLTKFLNFLNPGNHLRFYMPQTDINYFTLNIIKRKGDAEIVVGLLKNKCTKESTTMMIMEKFSTDDDLQVDMLKVSINCPLGKTRIKYPCRSIYCTHLQCFDGLTYMKMNQRKAKWKCPVCYKNSPFNCLKIDRYFEEIVNSDKLKDDTTEIKLLSDGSWSLDSVTDTIEILDTPVFKANTKSDVIELLDDTPKKPGQNGISRFLYR